MADRPKTGTSVPLTAPQRPDKESSISKVAGAIIGDISRRLDPVLLQRIYDAALDVDRSACSWVIKSALLERVRPEDIADFYIPEVARRMGDLWCSDELGFASVTIGTARLQVMLRELGPSWSGQDSAQPNAPSLLLLVPQDAYHTLGAMVLAGQLRRRGCSIKLLLGATGDEVALQLGQSSYAAAFVSASLSETLETIRRMVDVIRGAAGAELPIVVGGSLLDVEQANDIVELTGATYATKLPEEALRLCGLKTSVLNSATTMRRT